MKREKLLIVLGFCLISILWGSTWLAIKIGLYSVPPLYGVALRFTVAVVLLLVVVLVGRVKIPTDPNALTLYLALGIFSFSIPYALVYIGEQYISSGLASIVFCAYPLVVGVFSQAFLPGEPLNLQKVIGIVLGFLGILYIFWSDVIAGGTNALGMGIVFTSTILQAYALIIAKKRGTNIDSKAMTFGGMLVGLVFMYAMAWTFEDFARVRFDSKAIGSILYLSSFGTVITFVTYYWLMKKIEAVYLSLSSFVTPIIAVILGAVVLRETVSPRLLPGAGVVLIGILITNSREIVTRSRNSTHDASRQERKSDETA